MTIKDNKAEGTEIEQFIGAMLRGTLTSEFDDHDIDLGKFKIEIKSFYFYTGTKRKQVGKVKINANTHNNIKHPDTFYYIFIGKSLQSPRIRMPLILSWREVDGMIKGEHKRANRFPSGVECYELSWIQILKRKYIRKLS
ncbi:MAG: hypothetical protein WC444_05905 [Candidatus Paceibacterota bacterium]